jgi:hypothetical protein
LPAAEISHQLLCLSFAIGEVFAAGDIAEAERIAAGAVRAS